MDNAELKKTAKRIASELILLPRKQRGKSSYTEEYLREVSQCRLWLRLRCANCDCFKKLED